MKISDINNDGKEDVVILSNDGIIWLKNPAWEPVIISDKKFHDIEIHDLNRDGVKEVIVRNQSLFGHDNGDKVYIFSASLSGNW